jgi:hypothetical protein
VTDPRADRVTLWWSLFLLSTFLARGAGRLSWRAVTAADETTATTVMLFSDAIDVPAAILAIMLIGSVTRMQQAFVSNAAASSILPSVS